MTQTRTIAPDMSEGCLAVTSSLPCFCNSKTRPISHPAKSLSASTPTSICEPSTRTNTMSLISGI